VTTSAPPDCLFCLVVAGSLPSARVHEDDATVAFLDLRQPSWPDGVHVLVVPRRHVEVIDELDPDTAAHLMQATVKVAGAVKRHFRPPGLSIWQSNGPAAFQEVPHVHLHVLTRQHGDGLVRIYRAAPHEPPPDECDTLAAMLRRELR
jgi:histidine triad (HIT) family protein